MFYKKLMEITKGLENPEHPLLGPNIYGLQTFGMWQCGGKFKILLYNLVHTWTYCFVVTQVTECIILRNDFNKFLNAFSLATLGFTSILKSGSYVFWQKYWKELAAKISKEELSQLQKGDPETLKIMREYTKYSRIITYFYWTLVAMTNILMIFSPLLKYATSASLRENIKSGEEPLPEILISYIPYFDKTKMPGYWVSVAVQIFANFAGGTMLACYDTNAIVIMTFLKGQMMILKLKCQSLFQEENVPYETVRQRIKECHRHHSFLTEQHKAFNELLSPLMFIYVLVCSVMICCAVVQLRLGDQYFGQKLCIIEYTTALISQLLFYCWHCNEATVQSAEVDRGIYESDWWKADVRSRKQLLLLSGKLTKRFVFYAGPFTTLSVPTFVEIMKGSYSFYTLFTQMEEGKQ